MSKLNYCQFCGRELDNGRCTCDEFIAAQSARAKQSSKEVGFDSPIICDTCGHKINGDSIYCPYCGLPINANGKIKDLQKELRGENAPDVIEVYKEDFKKAQKRNRSGSTSFILMLSIFMFAVGTVFGAIVVPSIHSFIRDIQLRMALANEGLDDEEIESSSVDELTTEGTSIDEKSIKNEIEQEEEEESTTTEPRYHDEWVRRDGKYYAYDSNGNMIKNKWIDETNDKGETNRYYFTKDGILATNTWIDLTYYVGADGAMYRSTMTPDGDYVDEDGRIVEEETNLVEVEQSQVQYAEPNSNSPTVQNNQSSAITGVIKGIDSTKTYSLYVHNITRVTEQVSNGAKSCNLLYYVPVFKGADNEEVAIVNSVFNNAFKVTFNDLIKKYILNQSALPKSVIFTEVSQKSVTSNKLQLNIQGTMTPESGQRVKLKYRFVYDRKSGNIKVEDISTN